MGNAASHLNISENVSDSELLVRANGCRLRKRKSRHPVLRAAGIKQCELVVGMDFTSSNEWTGKLSFEGKCLHDVSGHTNPYMRALSLVAETLGVCDADHLIPCYGFGDAATEEHSVFSFFGGNEPAKGLDSLLERYQQIAPSVKMLGPTSFAPLIRQAMQDVYNSGMKHHVLLILADGQISKGCMNDTSRAILEASAFPLSIIMIGVGDGPWAEMNLFAAELPERKWNNFHFLEFNRIVDMPVANTQEKQENKFETHMIRALSGADYKHVRKLTSKANKAEASRLMPKCSAHVTVLSPPDKSLTRQNL